MKNLDKLIIRSFLGPFILTFLVVVFILLTQFMLKYLDDFVGKGMGLNVFATLIFYFSIYMVPVALPLAILLSSLMTFGNLGEHHELTAIKSSGISLLRILLPIFIIVIGLTITAFLFNNYIVPKANIKAWSLLYDIRQKKPVLNFKEGTFYNGIPNYSIKINHKYPDGKTIKDIMIYDHTQSRGNTDVILADSGKMSTTPDERYLDLELFKGNRFSEYAGDYNNYGDEYIRNNFSKLKIRLDLSSFDLNRTKEELFATNKIMRNIPELRTDIDSLDKSLKVSISSMNNNVQAYYQYQFKKQYSTAPDTAITTSSDSLAKWAQKVTMFDEQREKDVINKALSQARNVRSFTKSYEERVSFLDREINLYQVEIQRKFTQSIACLILFLIGAPLGAIVKKGGLGIPVIISIIFFIVYYVLSIIGEKWAKEGVVYVPFGMWAANFILFWIGLFFLRKARNDSSLLDADYYVSNIKKLINKLAGKRKEQKAISA